MPEKQTYQEEELSFKGLVLSIKVYIRAILKAWKWIALFVLLGFGIFTLLGIKNHKWYEAEVSFMINDTQGGLGGISALLGQFSGFLGASEEQANLQKILELSKTMRIAQSIFFTKAVVDQKDDFLANHLIRELDLKNKWSPDPIIGKKNKFKGFLFKSSDVAQFSRLESEAFKRLHKIFSATVQTGASDKTGIMKISIQSPNEELAYQLCKTMFSELSQFYVDKTIEKQRETYLGLKMKTDSLKNLMVRKEYGLAGLKDSYRGTWLQTEEVPKTILDRDIRMLLLIYGETVKNLELASFSLENVTPYIQAIDPPMLPLEVKQYFSIKNIILCIFACSFLAIITVIVLTFYKQKMSEA
ncbi:MAG TPA: hypothetical protein PKD32_11615 [Saprospiraceae bacterium]|jgi:hypothetical protein|nr:hypothetical protein [Saprospiraceae bacterium]